MNGQAPASTPLVLLHDAGSAPMAWEDVVVPLYGSRRLLTPWVPGLRPTGPGPLPLPEAAAALDSELLLEGVQQVDVCGTGFGAMVAAQLAADVPDRVRRLVLMAVQERPSRTALRMQGALARLVPASRLADAGVSKTRLLQALELARGMDLSGSLPRVQAPTLVVVGSRDRAGQAGARAVTKAVPDARLRLVEGAGRTVDAEAPAELVTVLRDFLD